MSKLAAICDTCKRPFPSGFSLVAGSTNNLFAGNKSGPCPWCGGKWGHIPDGVFDVDADDLVRLTAALPGRLADILGGRCRNGTVAFVAMVGGRSSDGPDPGR
jgi:hypothetical protein